MKIRRQKLALLNSFDQQHDLDLETMDAFMCVFYLIVLFVVMIRLVHEVTFTAFEFEIQIGCTSISSHARANEIHIKLALLITAQTP